VYATVESLQRLPAIRLAKASLVSLTGSVQAERRSHEKPLIVDADTNVATLVPSLHAMEVDVFLRSHGLGLLPSDVRKASKQWLATPRPTHALVGIGSFVAYSNRVTQKEAEPPHIAPILVEVRKLAKLCQRVVEANGGRPETCPVCDVANHAFVPSRVPLPAAQRRRIEKEVARLNRRMLTVSMEELRKNRTLLFVVAGTPKKALALYDVMSRFDTVVCTDAETAEALLALVDR
jgi:DNA-binding transcriptional regulator LsrR (DeoR family)